MFLVVIGPGVVRPTNLGWTMRPDLQTYVLAFTHFRHEPWQWPVAGIRGVGHPVGTSIGNTDAIPVAAFPLKAVEALLPEPFQFLGAWLLLCFVLQGVFGALLVGLATPDPRLQVLGAALFVQAPALFNRLGHPALCAHWLLLAALWLLIDGRRAQRPWHLGAWMALTACVSATQPYLAAMVMALAMGGLLDRAAVAPGWTRRLRRFASEAGALVATALVVFWLCGYFLVGSVTALQAEGLGFYSMNVLGPVTARDFSILLPAIPQGSPGQYEGLVYFGAGWLLLCAMAVAAAIRSWSTRSAAPGPAPGLGFGWLGVVACTLIALSPVITVGSSTVLDLSAWAPPQLAVFRSSGRFGWVPMYTAFVFASFTIASRLSRRAALAVFAAAVALQAVDLSGAYRALYARERSPDWTEYDSPLKSPAWDPLIARFRHVVLVPPSMCTGVWNPAIGPYLPFSLIAGTHGVTINSGDAGRYDFAPVLRYCVQLQEDVRAGRFAADTLYVFSPEMRAAMGTPFEPLVCGRLDGFDVCAGAADAASLREVAPAAGFARIASGPVTP